MKITPCDPPTCLDGDALKKVLRDFNKDKSLKCIAVEDETPGITPDAIRQSFKKVIGRNYEEFKKITPIVFGGKCLLCKKTI